VTAKQRALRDELGEILGVPGDFCPALFRSVDGHFTWAITGPLKFTAQDFCNPSKAFEGLPVDRFPSKEDWLPIALSMIEEATPQ